MEHIKGDTKFMSIFNGKFCFQKQTVPQKRELKIPKIKSLLFKNSLNTINKRRNNNIPYKIESQHLVRWNTTDCWIVFTDNSTTAPQVLISTDIFKIQKKVMNKTIKLIYDWEMAACKV